ncbi:F-box protein CPR1-like [Rhododendron vialii]|uniref:F-box protein CPR1-like n=1 Tax=Rhododendron vialii TaxID=182163 RepID=UPI00266015DA|nr:F-box protein CPR1-like [Rhododendron vialii]
MGRNPVEASGEIPPAIQTVCKTWFALIQNPHFVDLHYHHRNRITRNNDSILVVRSITTADPQQQRSSIYDDNSEVVLSFYSSEAPTTTASSTNPVRLPSDLFGPGLTLQGVVQVFGPCNGIVCLTNNVNIVLCNPATREFKAVPVPPFSYPRGLKSLTEGVGFGYDSQDDNYKIVRIIELFNDDEDVYVYDSQRVQVFDSSSDSWRHVDASVPLCVTHFPCFEMFFNGSFHFYGCPEDHDPVTESILAFDIHQEVFRQIPFPVVCSNYSLSVLHDLLALIVYEPQQVETQYDIWVMPEYGVKESWTRMYMIGPLVGIHGPLTFWKDDELLMESSTGQLVSCDLNTQEIKELPIHGIPSSLHGIPSLLQGHFCFMIFAFITRDLFDKLYFVSVSRNIDSKMVK